MTSRIGGDQAPAFARAMAISAAITMAAAMAPGSAALPRDVERSAVIGRGADERQAQGDIDALVELQRFQRDQGLVVIHAQGRIIARACPRREQRVARDGAESGDPLGLQGGDGRGDDAGFLIPELAAFARVRVKCRNREARGGIRKSRRNPAATIRALWVMRSAESSPGTSAVETCTVSGTVRSEGPASIITASR